MRCNTFKSLVVVLWNSIMATNSNNIKLVLMDLSGTVHVGTQAVPGAVAACHKLVQNNVGITFLTNTSKQTCRSLLEQLRQMGFTKDILPSEASIRTSVSATRAFLLQHQLRPLCLVEPDLLQHDFTSVPTDPPHNCVVIGLAPTQLNYPQLNQAFRLLQQQKQEDNRKEPLLIAIHAGKYFRDADHELSLGPGGFVKCLEVATGVQAVVMGKPNALFFQGDLQGVPPEQVVMIGDDVSQDIQGALDAGIATAILVRTGKYMPGDDDKAPERAIVVDSVVEAVDYILSRNQQQME